MLLAHHRIKGEEVVQRKMVLMLWLMRCPKGLSKKVEKFTFRKVTHD